MLGHFERLLPPYPDPEPELPPKGFLAFVWRATTGLRGYIGLMALLSAGTSIYDALLFALLVFVVDWLGQVAHGQLWAERGGVLLLLAGALLASIVLVALQTRPPTVSLFALARLLRGIEGVDGLQLTHARN